MSSAHHDEIFQLLLRLGDDRIVLGHRLSEWCGHAHELEDDIALANIALDLIGQAEVFLGRAGEIEGGGRDADALVYFREAIAYRNCLLVELPRGDFGFTICRQLFFDCFAVELLSALSGSVDQWLAGVAAKCLKEAKYHFRYSSGWFVRLGDGTEKSHQLMQRHLGTLWPYTGELFASDVFTRALMKNKVGPDPLDLLKDWEQRIRTVVGEATLSFPKGEVHMQYGGREGKHTEHLGHLLSEIQILARSYPDARW